MEETMGKKQMMVMMVIGAIAFSAMSISSIIKAPTNNDFNSFAVNTECKAQGDFMPRPFDSDMMAPMEKDFSNTTICGGQGDIKPRPWVDEDEDEKDDRDQLLSGGQGDIKPRPWVDEDEDEKDDRDQLLSGGQGDIKPRPWDDDDDDDKVDYITHA